MESTFIKKIIKESEKLFKKQFKVYQKDNKGDLVTDLDKEVEEYLISRIKETHPDYSIISEELNPNSLVTDNCFIIDPIDGTINFANGLPLWGIQVACVKNGQTVASVIDLLGLNEFYFADETGAYLNDRKISVKEVPIKNTLYSVMGYDSAFNADNMRKYSSGHRIFGAGCAAFAFLASGRIHGVNLRLEQPWDYEPGLFLCKMAGARVKSVKGFHAAAINQEFLDILEKETAIRQE